MKEYSNYLYYDLPIPYKKIKIYPGSMKDYSSLNTYASCLLLDKNSIPNLEIIKMTDLEYIYYTSVVSEDTKGLPYILFLDRLFSLVLIEEDFKNIEESIKRYKYDEKGKPYFLIGEEKYTSEDFDNIKKIIAEQNMIELIDENISKEVRDSLEKAQEYKNKMAKVKPATLEDYMISLSVATGWELEYIYNLTIRKFTKSIERLNNLIHYKIYLSASMSGFVEFKDKSFIKHWLSNLEEDKYKDVSVDLDVLQNTVSFESAKKK